MGHSHPEKVTRSMPLLLVLCMCVCVAILLYAWFVRARLDLALSARDFVDGFLPHDVATCPTSERRRRPARSGSHRNPRLCSHPASASASPLYKRRCHDQVTMAAYNR